MNKEYENSDQTSIYNPDNIYETLLPLSDEELLVISDLCCEMIKARRQDKKIDQIIERIRNDSNPI